MTDKTHLRGFGSLSKERRAQIASLGGKAAHAKGTAHQYNSDEARAAGMKGGRAAHARGTAHKFSSEEGRAAGQKGGASKRSSAEGEPA